MLTLRALVAGVLAFAALSAPPAGAGTAESGTARERKLELRQIDKEIFRKTLLVREDIAWNRPVGGLVTELLDGSYYEQADPGIAFEALSPAVVSRTSLREGGKRLLVTLEPPSYLVPVEMRQPTSARVGAAVFLDLDVDAAGGVRQALEQIVYLPGRQPDEAAVDQCLARYPEMSEAKSRMRCGLGRPMKTP